MVSSARVYPITAALNAAAHESGRACAVMPDFIHAISVRSHGDALLFRFHLFRNQPVLSFVLSTVAFFVVAYFVRRYLDDIGVPKTMVRGLVVFIFALGISYGIAFIVDRVVALIA